MGSRNYLRSALSRSHLVSIHCKEAQWDVIAGHSVMSLSSLWPDSQGLEPSTSRHRGRHISRNLHSICGIAMKDLRLHRFLLAHFFASLAQRPELVLAHNLEPLPN